MLRNLVDGLTILGTFQGLVYLFAGSIIGVVFGVIPGLGGAVILSIILAFIYHISLTGTVCLFLATQAASYYSASISSILLNTPTHPEAYAVTFDGFPMAQHGEAGRALGISATSTCIGGIIGCVALVGFIQIINVMSAAFQPPAFVALVLIALLLVGTLGTDKVSKAVISAGIGIMLSAVGLDAVTGIYRFTFNAVGLLSGISLVALVLGLFAVPQMVLIFGTATTIARQDMMGNEVTATEAVQLQRGFRKQIFEGILDALHHWVALVRGSLIGVVCGVIPGIGGFAANFLSYGVAQQTSKNRALFGTGIAEGIIAPESSSLSKEAGSMVPIIGLGIPGGVGSALFLAALIIKGVRTGYGFTNAYPSLPYEMMWVIGLSGIIGTVIGLVLSPGLARVTRVPGPLLVPFIMVLTALGPFVADISFFSVVEALCFALVGFVLRRLRYSLAAFVIGLVLGPTLENNIFLTHGVYSGLSFIPASPLADVLFAIAILVLAVKSVQLRRDAKKANPPILEEDPTKRAEINAERFDKQNPYPQLACFASLGLLMFSVAFVLYGLHTYNWTSSLFSTLGGGLAMVGLAWRVPTDAIAYVKYFKLRRVHRATVLKVKPEREVDPVTGKRALPEIRYKSWGLEGQYSRELCAIGIFCAMVGGMYVFGFLITVPVFMVLYGMFATRRVFSRIYKRMMYAGISAGVMWYTTYEMLGLLHLTFTPMIKI